MKKHTAGEWRAYYDTIVVDNPNPNHPHREIRIADIYGVEDGEGEANAAYIAKCVNNYHVLIEALDACFPALKEVEAFIIHQQTDEVGTTKSVEMAYLLGKLAHDINLLTHKAKH